MATVWCQKHGQEGTALSNPPYPGSLGQRIQAHICLEAWNDWLEQQTKLINEYRLSPLEPEARAFLEERMVDYLNLRTFVDEA